MAVIRDVLKCRDELALVGAIDAPRVPVPVHFPAWGEVNPFVSCLHERTDGVGDAEIQTAIYEVSKPRARKIPRHGKGKSKVWIAARATVCIGVDAIHQ